MKILIDNAPAQTFYFILIFLLVLLITLRRKESHSLDPELTTHLKGFAILAIVFSHIGYFLSEDTRFLFPLSVLAGVGVNLFLFLSGFGLTVSQLRKPLSPIQFYRKRLTKLFVPLWIVLTVFLLMDFLILQRTFPLISIIQNYLGFYPRADLFLNLNSPLWYFSLILFYYLLFPLVFLIRIPAVAAVVLLSVGFLVTKLELPVHEDVIKLYEVHLWAFPLGVFFAQLHSSKLLKSVKYFLQKVIAPTPKVIIRSGASILFLLAAVVFAYTAINSGVGSSKTVEQITSLVTMFAVIIMFMIVPLKSTFLYLIGVYSYEIYLIHWPILSRYDLFYAHFPGALATVLYIVLFIGLGFILQRTVRLIDKTK